MEELPTGFWESPAVPSPTPPDVSPVPRSPTQHETSPVDADEPRSELEEAFGQLQALFPGRVIEVVPDSVGGQEADELGGADMAAEGEDGEDTGPGQAELGFGPN